jgi:uncharacterized membrane protein YoaK (UPF0700 family)
MAEPTAPGDFNSAAIVSTVREVSTDDGPGLPGHDFFLLLACASGATDAVGFLKLGGAFTSVMTGNLILLALSITRVNVPLIVRTGAAILGYLVGCVVGVRANGEQDELLLVPSNSVRRLLVIEVIIFLAYAVAFALHGVRGDAGAQVAMLGGAAIALGIQGVAVQSFGVSGLSTTYLTGTLTSVAMNVARGRPVTSSMRSLIILLGLLLGAAAGTGLTLVSVAAAGWLPVVCVIASLGALRYANLEQPYDG